MGKGGPRWGGVQRGLLQKCLRYMPAPELDQQDYIRVKLNVDFIPNLYRTKQPIRQLLDLTGVPKGVRTPVAAVRGRL